MALEQSVATEPEEEDCVGIWRPFEGKLVEIVGAEPVRLNEDPSCPSTCINGLRGRVIEWLDEADKYAVSTFSGLTVCVSEEHLVEYEAADPEDGGFDLLWPQSGSIGTGMFAAMAAKSIEDNGYCVVQMPLGDDGCQQAAEWAKSCQGYHVLSGEYRKDYLGESDSSSKMTWLSYPVPTIMDMEQCIAYEGSFDGLSALEMCDQAFTNVAAYLHPYTQQFEDESNRFECHSRTNAMLRTSFDGEDEKAALNKEQYSMLDNNLIDVHHDIMEVKKICMLYLIDSEGGDLTLNSDAGSVVVPLTPNQNQLVLFDESRGSYTYAPKGRHVTVQAWILDKSPAQYMKEEEMMIITGPEEPQGERVNIMSLTGRYPSMSADGDEFWNAFAAGTDGVVHIPIKRWDTDVYYRAEHTIGYSMSCHGGHMHDTWVENFDNKFFGISEEEAKIMSPKDRLTCEVGYDVLYRAGYRQETLRGLHMGSFMGDSGSDWTLGMLDAMIDGPTPYRWAQQLNAVNCGRLSHIFGMVGPASTAETACSSSLVALGIAHMSMREPMEDQPETGFNGGMRRALVCGLNTMPGCHMYIGLSGPGMLTHKGRCFTFDHSADGYCRGEGIGGLQLKKCMTPYDAMGRVAMLIGTAINQDGRSASMTAPHGPSQSDVIKASMREAGVEASQITIAECHGTGTALGDPIEVGSLRASISKGRGEKPLLTTSAKSNVGHLEAGAGMAGIIKCILMLRSSTGAPNCHLCEFNPHLDIEGFPVVMETECMDFGVNSGLTGVSSFGFGGTNARSDVWSSCVKGPHACESSKTLRARDIYC